eukprot:TRINITY_DN12175_c0_g2_i1.p1 TRINITY_DN12175_c0_g2~~TRINITY_DN12175_c0_g2_i1.p1  ORF type:complete len:535 (-),score=141.47 TRINITY_DN12175_c0_g2_i1:61-1665(-)
MLEGKQSGERPVKPIQHANHIRYFLAKRKMDDLFMRWLSLPQTDETIKKLLGDLASRKEITITAPTPFFIAPRLTHHVATIQMSPQTPPRSPNEFVSEKPNRRSVDEKSPGHDSPKPPEEIAAPKTQKAPPQPIQVNVPQLFIPSVRQANSDLTPEQQKQINELFPSDTINAKDFEAVVSGFCGIPKFLSQMLFSKLETRGMITKSSFLQFWRSEFAARNPRERTFWALKKKTANEIDSDDFKPVMKILLTSHPGLEFLANTPEFQERYSETVVYRIFFAVDTNDDGRISQREFLNSNLFDALMHVDREEDINKVRNYFSYEHFYVLYCKFWELDTDHDFLISKDDFSRYAGYTLSKKVLDRIFSQAPRKFRSKVEGKMSYEDFVWYLLCEEDKMTNRAIDYWFRVLDLDENGIVTGFELEYFYEEQKQRLEYLNHESVLYEDVLCQMSDIFKPEKEIMFRVEHFRRQRTLAPIFFNIFTNLNKFVAYEQRDPFMLKNEATEFPDYSDWDKFAQNEYSRLAMEEENPDNQFELE